MQRREKKKVSVQPDRMSHLTLITVVKFSGSLSSIKEILPFMNSFMDILDPCSFPFILYAIAVADNPHFPYDQWCYRSHLSLCSSCKQFGVHLISVSSVVVVFDSLFAAVDI